MKPIDKKYVAGAAVLAVVSVCFVLRGRTADRLMDSPRAVVHVPLPADVLEPPFVVVEPVRASVPLIPPDEETDHGGTFLVMGRVIDDGSAKPIAGASIEHASILASKVEGEVTSTDEKGEFRFEAGSSEPEWMSISAVGHATLRFDSLEHVSPRDMRAGEVARLDDIRLRRGVQPILRVLDANAKPVEGAQLLMCESPMLGIERTTRTLGQTDEHGEWTATEPLAGSTSATFVLAGSGNACGFAPLALQAQGSRGELLEITLQPAVEVEVRALTQDPIPAPLTEVMIDLSVLPGMQQGLWLATGRLNRKGRVAEAWLRTKTGPDGVAHIWMPSIPGFPDVVSLAASREGFERSHLSLRLDDFDKPVTVHLKRSAEPAVVRATNDAPKPRASIRGRVVDEAGRPLEGIPLRLDGPKANGFAHSRADGSFCIPFTWNAALHVDELALRAGWPRESSAPFLVTTVTIDDTQRVDVVMKARPVPIGSVRARVLVESSSIPAPVVAVFLMSPPRMLLGDFACVEEGIVSDLGSFRASGLEPGDWMVGVISSDDRIGSAQFHVSESEPDATIQVRVGPMRSIIARVIPDPSIPARPSDPESWASIRIADGPGNLNLLALLSEEQSTGRRTRVADDGTFTIDRLAPGPWTVVVDGPRGHSERTVLLTTSADEHVTMYAKRNPDSALLQLTNLDSRFDGPLYVRLEREQTDPVEFVADPTYGRSQTFPVMSGKSQLVVYTMHDAMPEVDKLPVTRRTLDIPAGETRVVALYPR